MPFNSKLVPGCFPEVRRFGKIVFSSKVEESGGFYLTTLTFHSKTFTLPHITLCHSFTEWGL